MGEPVLRCLGCLGKFGAPGADQRCSFCSVLFRFSSLLLSDHFPVCGGAILEPELRQLYYRALEGADTFRRTSQGGQVPPGSGVEAGQPDPPALQPKQKTQPPQDSKEEEKPAIKEETPNYSPDKSPEDRKEPTTLEEEAASEKKKKKPRLEEERSPLPRRAGDSRKRRRSRSPQSSHIIKEKVPT